MNNIYQINIKPKSGIFTELQSDTLFGHFCWRLAEFKGNDTLNNFLKFYLEDKPIFTISDAFYSIEDSVYLPRPHLPIVVKSNSAKKEDKIINFLKHKYEKGIKYLTVDELYLILDEKKEFSEILKAKYKKDKNQNDKNNNEKKKLKEKEFYKYDLRVSVEISRKTLSSKEGQLFSFAPKFLGKDVFYTVFIKIIDEKNYELYECKNLFREVFEIGFGKKKSSGYGEFDMASYNYDIFNGFRNIEDSNAFITLSNYLPSKDDAIEESYYDFHVKYGKLGEDYALSKNPFKKPIIFISPGSVFKTNLKKEFYGRCTVKGEVSNFENVIQNGIAFTLNMRL